MNVVVKDIRLQVGDHEVYLTQEQLIKLRDQLNSLTGCNTGYNTWYYPATQTTFDWNLGDITCSGAITAPEEK